jgi:hypothetical protein
MFRRLASQIKARFADRQRLVARKNAAHAVISQSKLFDPQWYSERYPDIASMGMDPLDHFILHGANEGRNPSPRFDLRWYLKRHPDVGRTGINPLLHYLQHGRDEGRAIHAVSKSREDEDFDLVGKPRKKKIEEAKEPLVDPYPSDFIESWRARPAVWSALSTQLDSRNAQGTDIGSEGTDLASDWFGQLTQAGHSESAGSARVRLLKVMQRDAPSPSRSVAAQSADPAPLSPSDVHRLLTTYGLGLEAVVDGWFANATLLMLRIRHPAAGALRLRAFQYGPAGEVISCAETGIVDGDIQLVGLALDHELYPVLLTWQARDGSLIASTLLPFPSLFRGGLHHAEIAASETISGKRETLGDHMTSLALQAYCPPDPDAGFAVRRIAVDLQGANGSEPIFSAGAVAALATQFGLELSARKPRDDDGYAAQLLGKRLQSNALGDRAAHRAKAGQTLVVPADGFPSLACLVARSGGMQLGVNSFCVVHAATRLPEALVSQPALPVALGGLHHPALPLPCPILEEEEAGAILGSPHFGAPLMIRFRDAKVWLIDDLMPLSPDTPMRGPASDPRSRITIIIDKPLQDDHLALCLASLAHQTIADRLDILLIGDEEPPQSAIDLFGEQRIARTAAAGASRAERLDRAASSATSDYLLFLDATVCLPDPRSLALLLEMASQPQVASTSCALVREDDADGSISVESAGYFGMPQGDQAAFGLRAEVAKLLPASTYPVVANDMRLCLIPAGVWRDVGGLKAGDLPDHGLDLDFGLRAGAAHLSHYCTTLSRAAVAGHVPTADAAAYPAISSALSDRLPDQITRIRELR